MLDTELIQHIDHYDTGFRVLAGSLIDWIANNLTRAIEFRKTDLIPIRPGAVTMGEPWVIWTKFMTHSRGYNPFLSVKTKYNDTMDEILAEKNNHYVMDFGQVMHDNAFYTPRSVLTEAGRIQFLSELNQIVKDFDYGKVDLIPIPHSKARSGQNSNQLGQRYPQVSQEQRTQCNYGQAHHLPVYSHKIHNEQFIPAQMNSHQQYLHHLNDVTTGVGYRRGDDINYNAGAGVGADYRRHDGNNYDRYHFNAAKRHLKF